MSTTRAQVLTALREWGHPITTRGLASVMDRPAHTVRNTLRLLYFMDRVDRFPNPMYPTRFIYRAKELHA